MNTFDARPTIKSRPDNFYSSKIVFFEKVKFLFTDFYQQNDGQTYERLNL